MAGQMISREEKVQLIHKHMSGKRLMDGLKMALPKHMTVDRFVRCAFGQISKNPLLLDCTPQSIVNSVLQAGEFGLEPNGRDGHLVPYKNKGVFEAQFIADYKGLIRLAYQSDMVAMVQAHAVYEKDIFSYKFGTGSFIEHIPSDEEDRGSLIFAWGMAKLINGGEPFVVLNKGDIKRRMSKSMSAGSQYSPWQSNPEAMWAKSAVRELSKWIPQSPRLERAVNSESEAGDPLELMGSFSESPEDASANVPGEDANTIEGTSEQSQVESIERKLKEKQAKQSKAGAPTPEEEAAILRAEQGN